MADEVKDETLGFEVTSGNNAPESSPQEEVKVVEDNAESENDNTDSSEDPKKEETKVSNVVGEEGVTEEFGEDIDATANTEKKSSGVQKRISKLVREREEARRNEERLKREISELKGEKQNKSINETKEPQEKDFETYGDYLDALDKHEQNIEKVNSNPPKEEKKQDDSVNEASALTDEQKTAMSIINESINDAEDLPEDFKKIALADDVPISGEMLEAIAECDDPAKVLYHLGKNKDTAAKIAESGKIKMIREIMKIDSMDVAKLPEKPKTTTKAPDPIDPVRGSDAQKKHPNEMSFSEYENYRNEQERKKGSGW